MMWTGKRYWLIGASEGLGRAIAHELSAAGAELVLSARDEERLQGLADELPGAAIVAPCDVTDNDSMDAAAAKAGDFDGVVYIAGFYEPISARDWDRDAVVKMCDVNFTGCARAMGTAVPLLAERGGGHVIIIGSIAAVRGLPEAIGYGASKAGVAHLAETMRVDLDPEKFKVQLVSPGFIKTRLTDKNDFEMPAIMTPEDAAKRTRKAMESDRFETRFPKRFTTLFGLMALLPDALYFRLIRRVASR